MAKHYSDEFKERAVELVLDRKKSQHQIGRELRLTISIHNAWVRKHRVPSQVK